MRRFFFASFVIGFLAYFATHSTSAKPPTSKPIQPPKNNRSFREVMVFLQHQMNAAMLGILNEHYNQIQQAGLHIARHPSPSLSERKRLARTVAPVKARFRVVGRLVHQGAKEMAQAAQKKDMPVVLKSYHKVLQGCVGCHQLTRARFLQTKP